VDVAGNLARTLLLPALPQFLARYPAITLQIGESERDVDLVREGSTASFAAAIFPTAR
jgi:DNA-binding transcriptional LysR family regulator